MILHLELSPQIEAWINEQAEKLGLQPEDVAAKVIEERINLSAVNPKPAFDEKSVESMSSQQRVLAMDALAEQFVGLNHVTNSAFDRDTIY